MGFTRPRGAPWPGSRERTKPWILRRTAGGIHGPVLADKAAPLMGDALAGGTGWRGGLVRRPCRGAGSSASGPGEHRPGPGLDQAGACDQPARPVGASMAYDAATGNIVLFGGSSLSQPPPQ